MSGDQKLVRFSVEEINDRLPDFEKYGKEQLREAFSKAVDVAGLKPLREAYEHPWNEDEYLIYDGVSPAYLPVIEQVAKEMKTRYQYPCHRNTSAWGDGGKWYQP